MPAAVGGIATLFLFFAAETVPAPARRGERRLPWLKPAKADEPADAGAAHHFPTFYARQSVSGRY
jgi:hypothetical protein